MVWTVRAKAFAGTAALIAVLVVMVFAVQPSVVGALALGGALVVASAPGTARRTDVIAMVAVWAMVAAMFGLSGAGCFILAHVLVVASVRLIQSVVRPSAALLIICTVAACGAPLLEVVLADRWPIVGPLVALLLLGAPGLVLQRIASALRGRDRARDDRLLALAPQLVALAIGGSLGGLNGAAAALVIGTLVTPLVVLLAPGPRGALRFSIATHALGVLAAGLVACVATALALRFADAHLAAMAPAAGIGLLAGWAALRVHAPAAIERLKIARPATTLAPTVVETARSGR